jgi:DNA helicase-2/ATP-dependent DNA helicase PcrA
MYVAVTRAKDHLFISHATSRMQRWQLKYNPPSRFIDELPSHLIKPYDLSTDRRTSKWPSFDEGDRVTHKLFGAGSILEVRDSIVIVQFDNPKIGLRKMEGKFLSKI